MMIIISNASSRMRKVLGSQAAGGSRQWRAPVLEAAPRDNKNTALHDDAGSNAAEPHPSRLAREPALPAAQPDIAVLGGQRRPWTLCRRACSADCAGDAALGRRVLSD